MAHRSIVLAAALALAAAGCSSTPHAGHHAGAPAGPAPAVLLDGLGSHHQAITTTSREAQAYFDQGLRLVYAFNHLEAERAFREAARLDPACAMCYWGIALTQGTNYNSPTDAGRETVAYGAIQQALANRGKATPREQALVEALARRHAADPKAERAPLDRAYADAMREVVRRFPDDLDAATLFADSLMNLRPWDLWEPDGRPKPGTGEIVETLERVLARSPDHPGANHLYIHAVEASPNPRRAEAAADRLRPLMPAAGHVVHMPSHIYWRVGRYDDAYRVNVAAAAADRAYIARRPPSPEYRMGYYPHNLDFVWHAASMEGRSAETLRAAREFADAIPAEAHAQMGGQMETAPAAPILVLVRFGRWEDALRQPEPPASMPYVRGAWRYARGVAFAATGRRAEAERELAELRGVIAAVPAERGLAQFFTARDMLELAADVLAGEIAARSGDTDTAVRHLLKAVATQDGHWFTEPPPWYYPVRHSLGAALLAGGRPAEAEAVYRDDLARNPENGWALFGLAQSLRAQGKADEAARVDARFRRAWARADVTLTGSRF
jgi:tetratricopeptide (TPR) repeat protein